jgi:hypothetical protein
MTGRVVAFVSRAEQLSLRGPRNFDRYMQVVKGVVAPDGPERLQWQREAAQDSLRDAQWDQRHGPVLGGARVLSWPRSGGETTPPQRLRRRPLTKADSR